MDSIATRVLPLLLLALGACSNRPLDVPLPGGAVDLAGDHADAARLPFDLGIPDLAVAVAALAHADTAMPLPDLAHPDLSSRPPDLAQPRDLSSTQCQSVVSTLAGNGRPTSIDGTGGANGTASIYGPDG